MLDYILNALRSFWTSEPVRLLYVVAIALSTFATLSLGGETTEAILRGVLIAVVGEIQRQRVYSPKAVSEIGKG